MAAFLFVTKPETNPSRIRSGQSSDWSCSARVNLDDRALLYVTGGRGIEEEWRIESLPWKKGRYYRCNVRFVRTIHPSITIRELKALAPKWAPAQQNLRGHHATLIPENVYDKICLVRPPDFVDLADDFEKRVQESRLLASAERRKRLEAASSIPERMPTVQWAFRRNPDVVAEVLTRAGGRCERCKQPAPFRRRKGGDPYLEVHHKKKLSDGGKDTVGNAMALCPNCHRRAHYA